MKKYTITLNSRKYVTTNCLLAWSFCGVFNACAMHSEHWDGFPIPELQLESVYDFDMSELFI